MSKGFIRAMLKALPKRVSKADAEGLLKARKRPYSAGNWDDLIDQRLLPALEAGAIVEDDLVALWRGGEEGPGFHAFLFQCPAEETRLLIAPREVKYRAAELEIAEVLERPLPVRRSSSPKIVDLRWSSGGQSLVVRVEETRRYKRIGEPELENGSIVRSVVWESIAAMNLLEIHDSGLVEVRLQPHPSWVRGSDYPDYERELGKMKSLLEPFLGGMSCSPLSLIQAKNGLWPNRARLREEPRFVQLQLRNSDGVLAKFSAGRPGGNLAASAGTRKAADAFLKNGGNCEEISLWWSGVAVTLPKVAKNELIIGRGCSGGCYANILAEVLSHN